MTTQTLARRPRRARLLAEVLCILLAAAICGGGLFVVAFIAGGNLAP